MIKAFIFDLDGTITESEALHRKAFNILLRKYHLFIPKKLWREKFVGTGSHFIAHYYIAKYHLPEKLDDFVQRRKQKYQELLRGVRLKTVPCFFAFYNAAKRRGIKIIIASSGHYSNCRRSLRAIGLFRVSLVSIEHVHSRKPNPEIFLKAAKRLRVKPSECLVFEDSRPGILAAKRAGMKVVALTTTTPRSLLKRLHPDVIIKDYRHLHVAQLTTINNSRYVWVRSKSRKY